MDLDAFVVCDDIRLEADGKLTLVGVYSGGLRVPQNTVFPAVLAKLAFLVRFTLNEERDQTLDTGRFKLSIDGRPIYDNSVPLKRPPEGSPLDVRFMFSPFGFDGLGTLSAELEIMSGEYQLKKVRRALSIDLQAAEPEASAGE